MAASFPTSIKTFTQLTDGVDYPQATHLNQAYDEIEAIETILGANLSSSKFYNIRTGSDLSNNPTDATTYYMGALGSKALTTAETYRRLYLPYPGTIVNVDVTIFIDTTLGSAETSTLYIRKNGATDTAISSALALNANPYHERITGLSVDLTTANDYFTYKWITPSWATNPQGVYFELNAIVFMSST